MKTFPDPSDFWLELLRDFGAFEGFAIAPLTILRNSTGSSWRWPAQVWSSSKNDRRGQGPSKKKRNHGKIDGSGAVHGSRQ